MANPYRILSLGAGVQSSALALMFMKGTLKAPKPDAAIFADTQQEPRTVYQHLAWLETLLDFPVYRVTNGDLGKIKFRRSKANKLSIDLKVPVHLLRSDGSRVMLSRRCTTEFKIKPIQRKIIELIGGSTAIRSWKRSNTTTPLVTQYIGISLDEADRMKINPLNWCDNQYPLVDENWTRTDCDVWFFKQTGKHAPRSACVFCPYNSNAAWKKLEPEAFAAAVVYEKKIQEMVKKDQYLDGVPYLHSSCTNLDQVRLKSKIKVEQESLFNMFRNECEGMCGV